MIIPVILCGGKGVRLWPLSKNSLPKPFVPLPDGENLFYKSLKRALTLPEVERVILVTHKNWQEQIEKTLDFFPTLKQKVVIIFEPASKNTAPALFLACLWAKNNGYQTAKMLLLTADHLIQTDFAFHQAIKRVQKVQDANTWVLFGIKPTHPVLGYGYIQVENTHQLLCPVLKFVEKPSQKEAEAMILEKNYFWNSGMLLFSLESGMDAFFSYAPAIFNPLDQLPPSLFQTSLVTLPEGSFDDVPNISSDYALLEHYPKLSLSIADFEWMDIGTWESFSHLLFQDEKNNRFSNSNHIFPLSQGCISYSTNPEKLVIGLGLTEVVLIETQDILFVCQKDKLEEWKKIYENLEKTNPQFQKKI